MFLDEAVDGARRDRRRPARGGRGADAPARAPPRRRGPRRAGARRSSGRPNGDPCARGDEAHAELAKAWRLLGFVHGSFCRYGDAAAAVQEAIEHARLAGDDAGRRRGSASAYTLAALTARRRCQTRSRAGAATRSRALGDRQAEALVLCSLAHLRAMQGDFEEARELYTRARALLEELGLSPCSPLGRSGSGAVEMLAGDPARAEEELRPDYETLTEMGEKFFPTPADGAARTVGLCPRTRGGGGRDRRDRQELAAEDDLEPQVSGGGPREVPRIRGQFRRGRSARPGGRGAHAHDRRAGQTGRRAPRPRRGAGEERQTHAAQEVIEESRRLYESKQSSVARARRTRSSQKSSPRGALRASRSACPGGVGPGPVDGPSHRLLAVVLSL